MQPEYDYSMAFLAGLLGSAHCIGMCGSLASAFFIKFGDKGQGPLPYAAYHGGRIGIYMLFGMAAGLIGLVLSTTGIIGTTQGVLQIVAGVFVILLGLDILGVGPMKMSFTWLPLDLLRKRFVAATEKGPIAGSLMGGIINGFMPCPLTFAVAIKATTAGGPLQGAGLMLAFGLGTLPSMLFVSALFSKLGGKLRGQLLKVAALFIIGLGISTLFQGASYIATIDGMSEKRQESSHTINPRTLYGPEKANAPG
jgi:uncharacterized protein